MLLFGRYCRPGNIEEFAQSLRVTSKQIVPHANQTDLNREFENRSKIGAEWFFIALLVLSAIDYYYLGSGQSAGL